MQEFTNGANIKAKTTWIYARPDLAFRPEDFSQGHGTCMLSKVTGDQYGVSKNVSPIVVKVPSVVEGGNGNLDWVDGVRKSYEDYKIKLDTPPRLDEKIGAIISLSFQIQTLDPPAVDYFKVILQSLVSVGVLPVTGSGNQADTVSVSLDLSCPELHRMTDLLAYHRVSCLVCKWDQSGCSRTYGYRKLQQ